MEFWMNDDIDLMEITDSMELDSNVEIVSMQYDNIHLEIWTRGEVRVFWNPKLENRDEAECYTCPSEFPQDLKDLIHFGTSDGSNWMFDERVYVSENNWFEMFVRNDETGEECADVVDIEGLSKEEVIALALKVCEEEKKKGEELNA